MRGEQEKGGRTEHNVARNGVGAILLAIDRLRLRERLRLWDVRVLRGDVERDRLAVVVQLAARDRDGVGAGPRRHRDALVEPELRAAQRERACLEQDPVATGAARRLGPARRRGTFAAGHRAAVENRPAVDHER